MNNLGRLASRKVKVDVAYLICYVFDRRKMLEEANQRVWASKERERNQNVSLRMQIVVRPAAYLFRIDEGKDAEEQKVMEGQLAAAIDTESEIRVGMPVHARYGGLNFYYPGYIYQVCIFSAFIDHVKCTSLHLVGVALVAEKSWIGLRIDSVEDGLLLSLVMLYRSTLPNTLRPRVSSPTPRGHTVCCTRMGTTSLLCLSA